MDLNSVDLQEITEKVVTTTTLYGMDVMAAIIILIVGWVGSKWAAALVRRGMRKIPNMDLTIVFFFGSLVRYAIMAVTILAVLAKFGIQTTSLVAMLGAAGLAIGLAMQGTLSHVAAGVMLLIFRPFKVGDYIEGGGTSGTVNEINLFFTELATPDNVEIIVPNAGIWNSTIKNYSQNKKRRLDLFVGIGYADDMDKAINAFKKLVEKDERVLKDPAPMVVVDNLGDSSVNIRVRFWVRSADYWETKFDMTKALKETCDKEGLEIPFPQRTVHMVK